MLKAFMHTHHETELDRSPWLRHWRQLKEIARQNQLYSTKWLLLAPNRSCHCLQSIEVVSFDHGDLVHDQVLAPSPPCSMHRTWCSRHRLLQSGLVRAYSTKRVKSAPSDQVCSHAGAGSDESRIWRKSGHDATQEERLPCSSSSGQENVLARCDRLQSKLLLCTQLHRALEQRSTNSFSFLRFCWSSTHELGVVLANLFRSFSLRIVLLFSPRWGANAWLLLGQLAFCSLVVFIRDRTDFLKGVYYAEGFLLSRSLGGYFQGHCLQKSSKAARRTIAKHYIQPRPGKAYRCFAFVDESSINLEVLQDMDTVLDVRHSQDDDGGRVTSQRNRRIFVDCSSSNLSRGCKTLLSYGARYLCLVHFPK